MIRPFRSTIYLALGRKRNGTRSTNYEESLRNPQCSITISQRLFSPFSPLRDYFLAVSHHVNSAPHRKLEHSQLAPLSFIQHSECVVSWFDECLVPRSAISMCRVRRELKIYLHLLERGRTIYERRVLVPFITAAALLTQSRPSIQPSIHCTLLPLPWVRFQWWSLSSS